MQKIPSLHRMSLTMGMETPTTSYISLRLKTIKGILVATPALGNGMYKEGMSIYVTVDTSRYEPVP